MNTKRTWKVSTTVKELNERTKNSFSSHLGIEFTEIGDLFLKAKMPISSHTMQPMGIMHGGASAALAETVASAAANLCLDPHLSVALGLELNINHIKAMRKGWVIATTTPLHLGKQTHVWKIEIRDEQENLVSESRLTLFIQKHQAN